MDRRTFLQGSALTALLACRNEAPAPAPKPVPVEAEPELHPAFGRRAALALQAARDAGASYADVRFSTRRSQRIGTREARVTNVSDTLSTGFGVRVIAAGTWGFAASNRADDDAEIVRVAKEAVVRAKANAALQKRPVELAQVTPQRGVWRTPDAVDPFEVPLPDKVALLFEINAAATTFDGVKFCSSSMHFVREHKFLATSEGTAVEQTLERCNPSFRVTSVRKGSFHTRSSLASPQGRGWDYIAEYPWLDDVKQAAVDAIAMHEAKSVTPGKRDLILVPSHLWLTIHESIGHPTELDRAVGLEANFAGTSFLTTDKLGSVIASDIVNFRAERSAKGGLATAKWDDDGVPVTEWDIVKDGVFVDYQTTRDQAAWIGRNRSYACSYAQSWADVAFQRMPNINLLPNPKPLTLQQLIADTEDAILIEGRGSYSIDHQRYNFQFGGQVFRHVKDGRVQGLLKDVAYQATTTDFWKACDAICDASEYRLNGSFYDGKGEPGQSNGVSHGCVPARFRGIDVLNTGGTT